MNVVLSWKPILILGGAMLLAAVVCLVIGSTDMASALFVVGALDIVFGSIVMMIIDARRKTHGSH